MNEKVLVSKDLLNDLANKFKHLTGQNKKFTIEEMIDAKVAGGGNIPTVTNIQLSEKGVLSFNAIDTSSLQEFNPIIEYLINVNGTTFQTANTEINVRLYLLDGTNEITISTIATLTNNDGTTEVHFSKPAIEIIELAITLPQNIYESSVVEYNGKAYIFGGHSGSWLDGIYEFDPTQNTITLIGKLPYYTEGASAVVINDKAYIFGNALTPHAKKIYEFDFNTKETKELAVTLPYNFAYGSAVEHNGKAYILGGGTENTSLKTIIEFDPSINTATTLEEKLPYGAFSTSSAKVNDKIYIFGGKHPKIQEFDITNKSTRTLDTEMPITFFRDASVLAINNMLYIFGGYDNNSAIDTIYQFEPITQQLELLEVNLPIATKKASACVINGKGYIFGGVDSNKILEFNC